MEKQEFLSAPMLTSISMSITLLQLVNSFNLFYFYLFVICMNIII